MIFATVSAGLSSALVDVATQLPNRRTHHPRRRLG